MVSYKKKVVSSDNDIFKVAFNINNFGGFFRGSGILVNVRVCFSEVRVFQLGSLLSSTVSEGYDRVLKDIINREVANNRIFEFNDEFVDLIIRV